MKFIFIVLLTVFSISLSLPSDLFKINYDLEENVDDFQDLKNLVDWEDVVDSEELVDFNDPKNLTSKFLEEDAKLTVPQLIRKYGYEAEVHTVETQDGYILEMHRIPFGRAEGAGPSENKSVVFVQHGILSSSADWVIAGPKKGLAYLLADRGYDVWMGNARGNTYSKKHKNNKISEKKFWNFSWHEIGVYDLPVMIDYALEKSGQKQTYYIGHSQGTTTFYILTSEIPQYNSKIRAMFSLAPIAYMKHLKSPLLRFIALFDGPLKTLLGLIGWYEFLPSSTFLAQVGQTLCSDNTPLTQEICKNTLFILCGFNKEQLNTELLPIIMGHTPAGASTKQFLHYAQGIRSGRFRQYDYGLIKNKKVYGSFKPPNYKLNKITAPVSLHYSHNDWLAAEVDVRKLYKQIKNPIGKFIVSDKKFNHLDYLWAKDVDTLVYNKVFSLMNKY